MWQTLDLSVCREGRARRTYHSSGVVQPCFIITQRLWISNLSMPLAPSFLSLPLYPSYECSLCTLIHNSDILLLRRIPLKFYAGPVSFIYWRGEGYMVAEYKTTSWWPPSLTEVLALVLCYLFFKWVIYRRRAFSRRLCASPTSAYLCLLLHLKILGLFSKTSVTSNGWELCCDSLQSHTKQVQK